MMKKPPETKAELFVAICAEYFRNSRRTYYTSMDPPSQKTMTYIKQLEDEGLVTVSPGQNLEFFRGRIEVEPSKKGFKDYWLH